MNNAPTRRARLGFAPNSRPLSQVGQSRPLRAADLRLGAGGDVLPDVPAVAVVQAADLPRAGTVPAAAPLRAAVTVVLGRTGDAASATVVGIPAAFDARGPA